MKLFDRIKFFGKKVADNSFKVSSVEELKYCIEEKEKRLTDIKESLYELRGKRGYCEKQRRELEESITSIKNTCKTKYSDRYLYANKLKEAFELVKQSESKLNLLEKQINSYDILIKNFEDGYNVLNKEVSNLSNQLEELEIKKSFADTFKSYSNLNIGTNDVQIEKLIEDIEVDFGVTESKIQEKSSKTSVQDFINESKQEDDFENFLNNL